ncbi:MAG: tetratricopeptide repeat protein, partial [Actinomycetota bacterium]
PTLVPDKIASDLGLIDAPGEAAASEVTERHPVSPMNALIEFFGSRRSILVLDNCEHLVDDCARVVSRLLRSAPNLKVLATSREPLRADGETAWRLPSLSTPDTDTVELEELRRFEAVRLFEERAKAANPAFRLGETERVSVAAICRRLEGIPLAIELAASRMRAMTPADLATRLEDRFRLLSSSGGDVPRHQTLRAAIDWSHDLLDERERVLFRRLAVFSGGWTLEAAEGVCSDDALTEEFIADASTSLVDRSLVVWDLTKNRYRMLEMIRDYAAAKLDGSDDATSVKQRHLAFFADLVERAEPAFSGGTHSIEEQRALFERIDAEQENVRTALTWAVLEDPDRGLRIVGALPQLWLSRGLLDEAARWMEPLLTHERSTPTPARCRALRAAGMLAYLRGDFENALKLSREALELAETFNDEGAAAASLWVIGYTSFYLGDYTEADASLGRSLEICRRIGHASGAARALYSIAWRALHEARLEDREKARGAAEESLDLFRQLGDRHATVSALRVLGAIAYLEQDYEAARPIFEEACAIPQEVGCRQCEGFARLWLCLLDLAGNNLSSAARHILAAIALDRRSRSFVGTRLGPLATILAAVGRYVEAARLAAFGRALLDQIGYAGYPWENAGLAEAAQRAKHALGDERFEAESASGRAMSFDEAVETALKLAAELAETPTTAVGTG